MKELIVGQSYKVCISFLGSGKFKEKKVYRMEFLGDIGDRLYLFRHPKGYKECFLKKLQNIDYKIIQ